MAVYMRHAQKLNHVHEIYLRRKIGINLLDAAVLEKGRMSNIYMHLDVDLVSFLIFVFSFVVVFFFQINIKHVTQNKSKSLFVSHLHNEVPTKKNCQYACLNELYYYFCFYFELIYFY